MFPCNVQTKSRFKCFWKTYLHCPSASNACFLQKNYSILLVIGFARFPICFLPKSAVLFHNHFVLQILWIRGSRVYLSETFNPYWGKCNSSSFYWKSSPFGQWSLRWAIVRTVFVFLDQTTINAIDQQPQTTEIKLSLRLFKTPG